MDAINDSINSNSLLENTRNAQKQYADLYSTLDSSLMSPAKPLTLGVEVEIGEQSDESNNTSISRLTATTSPISISNQTQAKIAPDLSGLRSGQDLHNQLGSVSEGLKEIRSSVDRIATEIQPGEDYTKNDSVQDALGQIQDIIRSTTYAGKPVFSDNSEKEYTSAVEIASVPELTEKQYASIQSTIMANAENVAENNAGNTITKGSETFIISQSNNDKVFSFPEETTLDKINETISDYTQDPKIYPLIYFEKDDTGSMTLTTGEGKGPVEFGAAVKLTSLDGELFSMPLDSYSRESTGEFHQRDGRVVEGEKSDLKLTEELGEYRAVGTINLADDNVEDGVDTDHMRTSNHTLTRSEKFNERLGEDRRNGDGFAVTPVDPGGSSGSLTAGSELRDSSRSTNYSGNFDATATQNSGDVMLLPKENSTEPYVTMAEREAGVNGSESLDQLSKKMESLGADENVPERPERYRTMLEIQNGALGGETLNELSKISQQVSGNVTQEDTPQEREFASREEASRMSGEDGAAEAFRTIPDNSEISRNMRSVAEGEGIAVNENQESVTGNPGLAAEGGRARGSEAAQEAQGEGIVSRELRADEKYTDRDNSTLQEQLAQEEAAENNESQFQPEMEQSPTKGNHIGTNPTAALARIEGVVNETMAFTLQGERGSMEYVVASGVTVGALSLAINTTSDRTGVTADAANGGIRIAGALPLSEFSMLQNAYGFSMPQMGGGNNSAEQGGGDTASAGYAALGQNGTEVAESSEELMTSLGMTGMNSGVDIGRLGSIESDGVGYSIESFADAQSQSRLSEDPQFAREIVAGAYRQIDNLQSNIDALSSLNQRNTYEALERAGQKILGGAGAEIDDSEESEEVLNTITVGMNNSVSADGGRGISGNPLASLNLLSSIPASASGGARTDEGNPYLMERISGYQANGDVGVELETERLFEKEERALEGVQLREEAYLSFEALATRFDEEMTSARESLADLRYRNEQGADNWDEYLDFIDYKDKEFFRNIENAKDTIREAGRAAESEDGRDALAGLLETELQSEQSLVEMGRGLAAGGLASLLAVTAQEGGAGNNQEAATPLPVEMLSLQNQGIDTIQGAELASSENTAQTGQGNTFGVRSVMMDSMTTRREVSVTPRAGEDAPSPVLSQAPQYENIIKLFEDKIGTVMVHDQGYTVKDLEGKFPEMMESEPEVVRTVLDKALEDIDNIRQEMADLQAQELGDVGDAVFAALETYGSEQSASNPAVMAQAVAVTR